MEEEALIEAVIRVRLEGETFKAVHEKLVAEGLQCEASDVKKACNKASKRGHTGLVETKSQEAHRLVKRLERGEQLTDKEHAKIKAEADKSRPLAKALDDLAKAKAEQEAAAAAAAQAKVDEALPELF